MKATIRDAKSDSIDCKRIAELGYHEPNLQRFCVTRADITAKSLLASLAQLETVRQQLAGHLQHIDEMYKTLGVKIEHRAMQKAVEQIDKQIAMHRAKLCAIAPPEARTLAAHVRGLSIEQASVVLVALRDKQFDNRDQLVAFVGLDVKTRQSGSWQGKQVISKRGNGYVRKVLFQIGWGLMMNDPVYKAHYERMRARGKGYKTCIISCARKFLRFLFALYWKKTITLGETVAAHAATTMHVMPGAVLSPLSPRTA